MSSPPNQRERITRAALLAQIAAFHQQAAALEKGLADFTSNVELATALQPSLTTAARNSRAVANHLGAAHTLVEDRRRCAVMEVSSND
jgi:hypothetical protein